MNTTEGTTMTKHPDDTKGYEVWAGGKLRKILPTLDQARSYAAWIRHHEGLDTAVRHQP